MRPSHITRHVVACGRWALFLLVAVGATGRGDDAPPPAERRFRLEYGVTWKNLVEGSRVRIWLPVPPSDEYQLITVASEIPPHATWMIEKRFANEMLYCERTVPADGRIVLDMAYDVRRREARLDDLKRQELPEARRPVYLKPDRLVPISGQPLSLLAGVNLGGDTSVRERARLLYDLVDAHMAYRKDGTGWGRGDAVWACANGYGNCTDFHSLFMSLARSQGIPVRFEIGFSVPPDLDEGPIAGYHCWAFFHDGQTWVPLDISEADKHPDRREYFFGNLTADRVMFSVGRDVQLEPRQSGQPLNFFVSPYAECDGKPVDDAKMQLRVYFRNQKR